MLKALNLATMISIKNIINFILLAILTWGCWLMIQLSLPYTGFEKTKDFLMTKQNVYHITSWRISFYVHVFTSIFILLAGFTQFSNYILKKYVKVHRIIGWVYIVNILLITVHAAFVMALKANGGLASKASFTLLCIVWYVCTLMALVRVKQKKYQSHRQWMIRSFALTLSAITLRIYAYGFDVLNINIHPRDVYITIAWCSWVPNLIVAEIINQKKKFLEPTSLS